MANTLSTNVLAELAQFHLALIAAEDAGLMTGDEASDKLCEKLNKFGLDVTTFCEQAEAANVL